MGSPKTLYVAGHNGMVGQALVRRFKHDQTWQILTVDHQSLDLTNQASTSHWMQRAKPDVVIVAAAKVGGIHANHTYPAEFIYQNLSIATNLIHAAYTSGVTRLLFLGSSCVYPKFAPQPINETTLLSGTLEPTNEAYAIAKIAGVKMCEFYSRQYGLTYHAAMPTNLYGPGDNYHPDNSHVIPALIRRIHEAKETKTPKVVIWGTGTPRREFLHVDDLADACHHILRLNQPPPLVNIGSGKDSPILEIAQTIARIIGYEGTISTDPSKPDGTPQKLLDVSLLRSTSWSQKIPLEQGLIATYDDFLHSLHSHSLRAH